MHQFNGHEPGQTPADSEGQGGWPAAVHEVSENRTDLATEHHHTCSNYFLKPKLRFRFMLLYPSLKDSSPSN